MKLKNLLGLLLLSAASVAHAAVDTYSFSAVNTTIPDGNASGLATSLNVGSRAGVVESVTVNLNIGGGFNGDLYGYLVHSSGFTVLLNRVGKTSGDAFGYSDTGFNVTLASGGSDIHNYQSGSYTLNGSGQLTGTWAPDGRNVDPATVVNTDPSTATLDSFIGLDAGGTWTLFLADLSGGGISVLSNASITITTVPEPVNLALGIFGAVGLGVMVIRRALKPAVQD